MAHLRNRLLLPVLNAVHLRHTQVKLELLRHRLVHPVVAHLISIAASARVQHPGIFRGRGEGPVLKLRFVYYYFVNRLAFRRIYQWRADLCIHHAWIAIT